VQRLRIRGIYTIPPKAVKESRTRKRIATYARYRASAIRYHPLFSRRFLGQQLYGRFPWMMVSPSHDKPEKAPAGNPSLPRHPLNNSIAKKGPPITLQRSSRNGHFRIQFSSI
jgi:hypothetical protein